MKKILLSIPLIILLLIVVYSCSSEIGDYIAPKNNDRAKVINEAKSWYEANKPGETAIVRSLNSKSIRVIPNWEQSFRRQNKDYKVVEAAFIWEKRIGYSTQESYDAYLKTNDLRFLFSKSRLIIRTNRKTGKTDACVMTLIPEKDYIELTGFNPYRDVTFLDKKNFSGRVLYHSLNGEFEEGTLYKNGEIVNSITVFDVAFIPQTRCYVTLYDCYNEPIYEVITVREWELDGEMAGEYTETEELVQVGVQEICEPYMTYWDDNCKLHQSNKK